MSRSGRSRETWLRGLIEAGFGENRAALCGVACHVDVSWMSGDIELDGASP
jgi:hypothetical protein